MVKVRKDNEMHGRQTVAKQIVKRRKHMRDAFRGIPIPEQLKNKRKR